MATLRRILITLAAATALSTVASADSISYTTSTPISSSLTDWSGSLAFQQFDPTLGTLNSVELQFSSSLTTTLTVMNTSDSSSSGNVKTELQVSVDDSGDNLLGDTPQLDILSPAFNYSLTGGGNINSSLLSNSGSSDNIYALLNVLSEFTGTGTFSLNASTFTETDLSNTGGNTSSSQVTDAGVTGTVTYSFTDAIGGSQSDGVPEPATMALMGGALIGLGLFRKGLKKS
jgi:hypothetical protein